jgi:hypothetical protein
MTITVRPLGTVPTSVWDVQAMEALAVAVRGIIVERTQNRGIGEDGNPLKRYSTRPLTIEFDSDTGRRLHPKGGKPAYGRSANGRRVIVGRYYPGGYAEYKRSSRLKLISKSGRAGVSVDLTLSGQMMEEFRVRKTTLLSALIGLTGEAAIYGAEVNAARPWIGLADSDAPAVEASFDAIVADAMRRGERRK